MASIESKQSLSVESFSRNWVVNLQQQQGKSSSREGSFRDDSNSFIEMDPKLPPSQRFFRVNYPQDLITFDFPLPSESPLEDQLVHADELIFNGYLMPLVLKPLLLENSTDDQDSSDDGATCSSSNSNASMHMLATTANSLLLDYRRSNDNNEQVVHGSGRVMRCASLKRLSKRMLRKYLDDFLRSFLHKIGGRNGRAAKVSPSSTSSSSCAAPYSPENNWRRSCDSETSIYEAVLHCKRTIAR